jgi:Toxin SymE, type I toxin-antitoxin system
MTRLNNEAASGDVDTTARCLTKANLSQRKTMATAECIEPTPATISPFATETPEIPPLPHKPRVLTIGSAYAPRSRSRSRSRSRENRDKGDYVYPGLRLQGRWLEKAGFYIGDKARIRVESGRLVIEVEPSVETARPAVHEPNRMVARLGPWADEISL